MKKYAHVTLFLVGISTLMLYDIYNPPLTSIIMKQKYDYTYHTKDPTSLITLYDGKKVIMRIVMSGHVTPCMDVVDNKQVYSKFRDRNGNIYTCPKGTTFGFFNTKGKVVFWGGSYKVN